MWPAQGVSAASAKAMRSLIASVQTSLVNHEGKTVRRVGNWQLVPSAQILHPDIQLLPGTDVAAGTNPRFFGGTPRCCGSHPITSVGRVWLTSKPCKGGPWPRLRRLTALTGLAGQPSLATNGSTVRSG